MHSLTKSCNANLEIKLSYEGTNFISIYLTCPFVKKETATVIDGRLGLVPRRLFFAAKWIDREGLGGTCTERATWYPVVPFCSVFCQDNVFTASISSPTQGNSEFKGIIFPFFFIIFYANRFSLTPLFRASLSPTKRQNDKTNGGIILIETILDPHLILQKNGFHRAFPNYFDWK